MRNVFGLLFCIGICIPQIVFGVSVSPLSQTATVDPGDTVYFDVLVTNDTSQFVEMKPGLVGVEVDESTGTPIYTDATPLYAWLTPVTSFSLAANESRSVRYTFDIPHIATPGVYYGALTTAATAGNAQIGVESAVGSLITVFVSGDIVESLSVRQLTFVQDSIISNTKELFLELVNEGNIHTQIFGDIVAKDQKGIELARVAVPIDTVYAGMKRQSNVSLTLPEKTVGPVYIHIEGKYGLSQKSFGKTVTTWYVSKHFFSIASGVLGIVLLFGLFILFRKKKARV